MKNGIFWESNISNKIHPVLPLYFSEKSGINLPNDFSLSGYYKSESWEYEGWKTYYESEKVFNTLRSKHKINNKINLKINFETEKIKNTIDQLKNKEK